MDPRNINAYKVNEASALAEITTLINEIKGTLEPVKGQPFVVFHDSYKYIENELNFPDSATINVRDASSGSSARITDIR